MAGLPVSIRPTLALALAAVTPVAAQQPRDLPITRWAVLAPFAADTAAAALDSAEVADEARLAPGAAPVHGVAWRAATADSLGRVDLLRLLGQRSLDRRVAYAVAWLEVRAPRTVDLAVESDDDVAVWLNGVLVHRHVVTRAVWMETDTVTVRLGAGSNRLVFKVANRDGGFGFGGRILASSPDGLGGLAVAGGPSKAVPALGAGDAAVTVGPVHLPARAVLAGGDLLVPLAAGVTRWGGSAAPATITIGTTAVAVPAQAVGAPAMTDVPVPWLDLARLARMGGAALSAVVGPPGGSAGGTRVSRPLPGLADALLDELSRPISIRGWQVDSGRTALRVGFAIPAPLAGLPLVLEAAEFSRGAGIVIDGRPARADSAGLVPLCDRCVAGSRHEVTIDARAVTWWDPPSIRVPLAGWREIREGASWARRLAPARATALPAASTGDSLLAAAADPSKAAYRAIVEGWLSRLQPAAAAIRRDTIDVVGNSHLDVVWLWELVDGIEVLRNTWRTATKLLAKYPRMHFAASSAYYYALLERDDPALLARIRALVQEGRWDLVGGWWIEPDANMPSGESLVRQGLYGQRTLRRLFGRTARVAWTPDTFGYPWTLPQILVGSGLDGFVTQKLRWNDRNPWPAGLDAFWWEGPDGSRVLTYVPYGYDHDLEPVRLAAELDSTIAGGRMRRMLVLYGVGDHGGGPTIEMLERARDLARIPTFPPLRDASPDSALARMRRDLPGGPVLNDELYLEYHRGAFTTNGAMKWWNRRMEARLGAAEAAAALSPLPYPSAQLTRAWEMTLFNQMHDILPGTSIRAVHRQAEADYAAADSLAARMFDRSVRALVAGADTRAPRAGWRPYAVFNPAGRARGGVVRIPLPPGATDVAGCDRRGAALPSSRVHDTLRILVPPVPALAAAIVFVGPAPAAPAAAVPGGRVLENAALRVEIDSVTGAIARLYDKANRREVLQPGGNTLTMLEDRPGSWDAWNINHLNGRRTPVDQQVAVGRSEASGEEQALLVRRRRGDVVIDQRYVLPAESARLDIETTVAWHTEHQLLKAAFVLPFRTDSVTSEIAYGAIARPTRPRTSRDSARFEVPMHRWVDASAGGYGVAIVNDSKYGFDALGDTIRLSLLRAPTIPDAISDQRTHHFTYSIVPHAGDWHAPAVAAAADELNDPLRAVDVEEHAGGAPPAPPFVLEGAGVRLGALKRAEDGDALVLRLVETGGRPADAVLRFAAPAIVRAANLLEDPAEPESAPVSRLELRLRPWEIRTLLVRLKR